jgi:hypothetical protein
MTDRPYAPAAMLGTLMLILAIVLVVPAGEWLAVNVYLVVAVGIALLLYRRGIKPVSPTFPASLFVLALVVKLLFSVVRFWTVVDVYGGAADAPAYHAEGILLAPYFRDFDWSILEWYRFRGEGSTRMAILTGVLYSVMPASMAGSFIFFAVLAFTGSVLFYRAVRMASSSASMSAYTIFVFFLPSVLFWPSSLGKDAWVFFCSGLVAWGWAGFVRRNHLWGLVVVGAALLLINLVRPHIAAFMVASLVAAYLLYATRAVRSGVVLTVGAALLFGLGIYLVQSGAEFLKLEELTLEAVEDFYTEQQERTAIGGSSYATVSVFTPTGAVVGFVTALARPFPWETHNLQSLMISLETVAWLGFCWIQRRVFLSKVRSLRSDPFAAFAIFYSVVTLLALTSIGNFGIIARQRVMVLPFLWMLFI